MVRSHQTWQNVSCIEITYKVNAATWLDACITSLTPGGRFWSECTIACSPCVSASHYVHIFCPRRRNCILADEMGLGKTIQSITFLYEIFLKGIEGPYLVIAPLSTIPNWEREFRTWTELNAVVYHGSQASRKTIQAYEMYHRDAQVDTMKQSCWTLLTTQLICDDISCCRIREELFIQFGI